MPETAVDKYNLPQSRENKVGLTRQIVLMESKPIAKGMREAPDAKFRLGVLAADRAHNRAARLFGNFQFRESAAQ
jgi:hypothetical protein